MMSLIEGYRARYSSAQEEELSLEEYLQLCRKDPEAYASAVASRPAREAANRDIDMLVIEGSRRVDNRVIRAKIDTRPGKPIDQLDEGALQGAVPTFGRHLLNHRPIGFELERRLLFGQLEECF